LQRLGFETDLAHVLDEGMTLVGICARLLWSGKFRETACQNIHSY
jgi:hypothetical protein